MNYSNTHDQLMMLLSHCVLLWVNFCSLFSFRDLLL